MMKFAVVFACVFVAVNAALTPEEQKTLQQLIAKEDHTVAEVQEILRLDALRNPTMETASGSIASVVKRESDITFQRIRLDEADTNDNADRLDKIEAAVDTDVMADSITQAINAALASNSRVLALTTAVKDVNASLKTTFVAKSAFSALAKKASDDRNALQTELNTHKTDLGKLATAIKGFQAGRLTVMDTKTKTTSDAVTKAITDKLKPLEGTDAMFSALQATYLGDASIPVFRWNEWHTHQHQLSWIDANSNTGFAGIHPSQWTDGNFRADQMADDFKYLQRLFIIKGTASTYGATICTEVFGQFSSTDGAVCGAVFRIKNSASSTVTWRPPLTMTSFTGWSEMASVAMNGVNMWNSDCSHECTSTISLGIPSNPERNRVSTVIFISTSSYPYGYSSTAERGIVLMFRDDALKLPSGLSFIDDLDTQTGPWKK